MSLERINQNPRFTLEMVETKALANHPLTVIDVGARGGQEFHWNLYADQVRMIGFEPDQEECERLNQQASKNAAFFPIALSHEKGKRKFYQHQWAASSSFYPFEPTMLQRLPNEAVLHVVGESELETIDLDSFLDENKLDENKIDAIDFIKLDVEGAELDILKGAIQTLKTSVLGLSIEVWFDQKWRNQPSFSDIDLFLRSLGFRLFDLSTYRHARKTLLSPPIYHPEQTSKTGQIVWGQALFLRDGVDEMQHEKQLQHDWDQFKILKLASLMELFCLPDCAIELIQYACRNGVLEAGIMNALIDLLVPPTELEQLHSELHQLHTELGRLQAGQDHLQNTVAAMESSKFWKLRQRWINLKQRIKLK